MTTTIESNELKAIIKEALLEIIHERRDLVHELLEEALEDIALARAIEEGKESGTANRDDVFAVLQEAA